MKGKMSLDINEIIELIFEQINEYVEEKLGGTDNLIKAAAWKWWKQAPVNDKEAFEKELNECEKAYNQIADFIEVETFFGGNDEDLFNFNPR